MSSIAKIKANNTEYDVVGLGVENVKNDSFIGTWQGTEQEWEQADSADWKNWKTATTLTNPVNLGSKYIAAICYDGEKLIGINNGGGTKYFATSTDGSTWSNSGTMATNSTYLKTLYNNGVYIVLLNDNINRSTDDGSTWTAISTGSGSYMNDITYGNGTYVATRGTNKYYYSTDSGATWTEEYWSFSVSGYFGPHIAYGNGLFVVAPKEHFAYSVDGITWTDIGSDPLLTTVDGTRYIAYGNGLFVVGGGYGHIAYSSDGINWIKPEREFTKTIYGISFEKGVFICTCSDGTVYYSATGINWQSFSTNLSSETTTASTSSKIFISDGSKISSIDVSQSSCYTLDTVPTTSSTVYSAPNTASALTVTTGGSASIVLSDNQTYNRNAAGDTTTYQTAGSLYPNHLAFVDNVGVKIGNTLIADNTPLKTINGESIKGTGNIDTPYRNIGEIVASAVPLTDAGLHLLDGALISGTGSYADFVTYIAGLVSDYPDLFETEANWQTAVSTYGVCGKFVYDSVNNTIRLPKITGFVEGTTTTASLGDITAAGLPKIQISGNMLTYTGSGGVAALSSGSTVLASNSNINSIYGSSTTVQPQSIKALLYIVVATTAKTEIEVDIDEIATDLNGKADVDLSNVSNTGTTKIAHNALTSNTYDDLTLGASNAYYTATSDGYVFISKTADGSGQYVNVYVVPSDSTERIVGFTRYSHSSGGIVLAGTVPVSKGQRFTVIYTANGSTNQFKFVYANGSAWEKA